MLFLRGLYWRRGFSAAVLVVGIISAAVAAIGPLYARAAGESTLTDALRAGGAQAGLAFSTDAAADDARALTDLAARIARTVRIPGYGTGTAGESELITARTAGAEGGTPSTMVWRQDQCRYLVVTAGRCPTAVGEAMVPDDTVHAPLHWTVGEALTVHQGIETADGVTEGPVIGHARVVGAYRPRDFAEPYWFDHPYFQSDLGPAFTSAVKVGVDAVFVQPGQFLTAPPPDPLAEDLPVTKTLDVDVPLVPRAIRLADVAALRRRVAAVQRAYPRDPTTVATPAMHTALPHVLAVAARDRRQVQNATLVVVLELAALSLLVLFQVVGGAVEARGDEIALAKLRGLRPRRTVVFALAEPVSLLLVAAPLGFLLAWLVAGELSRGALVAGTPVAVTTTTGWALLAAFAGSALAAVLAAVRTVTRPVLEQWRNTTRARRHGRSLLVLDLAVAAVAVAVVVLLRTGDGDRPRAVFLLAPALIVFAVALLGVRLLPRLGRTGLRATRATPRIAAFLALRQTVRRPGGLRLAALLAVAAGLAIFAVCGEAVARGNRVARAQTELGAARQVAVQFESSQDPQTIVDRVDPQRRWAMAVATWSPDGGPSSAATINGRLAGVERDRLAAVAYRVRGQVPPATLARSLRSTAAPPATFRGTRLQVRLATTALSGDRPVVLIGVRKAHARAISIAAGVQQLGRHTYSAAVDCLDGCAFTGLTFDRTIDAADVIGSTAVLEAVTAGAAGQSPVPVQLDRATAWRGGEVGYGATVHAVPGGGGLRITYRATDGSSPVLGYADSPTLVPIVAAPGATNRTTLRGAVSDYTDTSLSYVVRRWVSPLPAVLDTGALADLDYLRTRLPNFDRESAWTVWLGPHAPPDAVSRLERAGLLVQFERTAADRTAALGRQGPALGLLLLFVCAIAAAVLAVGGTAVALLADARRRSFELAALRVVGVPQRTLRRGAVAEQALLLGTAVVLGLPSGYLAAALVLPVVPEFSDPTPVVLRYSPPVVLALACAAGFAVLLWATAVVAGRALVRGAVPARLREAAR